MNKNELRENAILKQKSLPEAARRDVSLQLTNQLLKTELWQRAHVVGVTVSMQLEWDTTFLIEAGWKENKIICVPKTVKHKKQMKFFRLDHFEQLEQTASHLFEPKENTLEIEKGIIDLLIVPGLLFDRQGYRIGFGGGYYDRFLMDFPNRTASLCREEQLIERLPIETHDLPVHYLVTENRVVRTRL